MTQPNVDVKPEIHFLSLLESQYPVQIMTHLDPKHIFTQKTKPIQTDAIAWINIILLHFVKLISYHSFIDSIEFIQFKLYLHLSKRNLFTIKQNDIQPNNITMNK